MLDEALKNPAGTFFGISVKGDVDYAHRISSELSDIILNISEKIKSETEGEYHDSLQKWFQECLTRFIFAVKRLNTEAAYSLIDYLNESLLWDNFGFVAEVFDKVAGLLKEIKVNHDKRFTLS